MGQLSYKSLFLLNIMTESLLPGPQEHLDREWDIPKVKAAVTSCFVKEIGNTYPSGYARVFIDPVKDRVELRLERSTYQDAFIDSCLQSSLTRFRQSEPASRSWSYAHILTNCDDKKCELTVLLNNFSENNQIKELVERRTPFPKAVEDWQLATRSIYTLIQLIGALSR